MNGKWYGCHVQSKTSSAFSTCAALGLALALSLAVWLAVGPAADDAPDGADGEVFEEVLPEFELHAPISSAITAPRPAAWRPRRPRLAIVVFRYCCHIIATVSPARHRIS
jgi:hypothetical protein